MNNQLLEEKVKSLYKAFAAGDIPAIMSAFHPDVVFERPGSDEIPYSGTFTGIQEVGRMFGIIQQTIKLRDFTPRKFCSNEDTVVVLGDDEADVLSTGKSYRTAWAQAFTFKDEKISKVQVYMDTLAVSNAFQV